MRQRENICTVCLYMRTNVFSCKQDDTNDPDLKRKKDTKPTNISEKNITTVYICMLFALLLLNLHYIRLLLRHRLMLSIHKYTL